MKITHAHARSVRVASAEKRWAVAVGRNVEERPVSAGVAEDATILDPGPDFSKTPAQTIEVLQALDRVHALGLRQLHRRQRHRAVHAFAPPRFQTLYRAWLDRGDSVLEATQSSTLADALARGAGRLETYVLPYQYTHLLPLVGTA